MPPPRAAKLPSTMARLMYYAEFSWIAVHLSYLSCITRPVIGGPPRSTMRLRLAG